jgi:hypothetical protein
VSSDSTGFPGAIAKPALPRPARRRIPGTLHPSDTIQLRSLHPTREAHHHPKQAKPTRDERQRVPLFPRRSQSNLSQPARCNQLSPPRPGFFQSAPPSASLQRTLNAPPLTVTRPTPGIGRQSRLQPKPKPETLLKINQFDLDPASPSLPSITDHAGPDRGAQRRNSVPLPQLPTSLLPNTAPTDPVAVYRSSRPSASPAAAAAAAAPPFVRLPKVAPTAFLGNHGGK